MYTCNSLEDTNKVGAELGEKLKSGGVVYLYGEMGSGKTTLTKGIARSLGINDFKIKSPTFNYIRRYNNLYHIDLYRLEEIDELLALEMEEIMMEENNVVVIEWAEKLEGLELPKGLKIQIKYLDETSREIEIDPIDYL